MTKQKEKKKMKGLKMKSIKRVASAGLAGVLARK